ncbi:hypothetical protein NGRA_1516 [Nosema granulosis]|uniref:Uncharacterized protein n=1 Tax=Nosema granulosis TaxID=83296 RepID=A0A9P6GYB5_9MICR|nr:hypothetical protein NGRA_1516 [Nosema granulosis]
MSDNFQESLKDVPKYEEPLLLVDVSPPSTLSDKEQLTRDVSPPFTLSDKEQLTRDVSPPSTLSDKSQESLLVEIEYLLESAPEKANSLLDSFKYYLEIPNETTNKSNEKEENTVSNGNEKTAIISKINEKLEDIVEINLEEVKTEEVNITIHTTVENINIKDDYNTTEKISAIENINTVISSSPLFECETTSEINTVKSIISNIETVSSIELISKAFEILNNCEANKASFTSLLQNFFYYSSYINYQTLSDTISVLNNFTLPIKTKLDLLINNVLSKLPETSKFKDPQVYFSKAYYESLPLADKQAYETYIINDEETKECVEDLKKLLNDK